MKKIFLLSLTILLCATASQAQLMVAKLIGKDAHKFGLGYGIFTNLDFPLRNENQSIRIELVDIAGFATKGSSIFSSSGDARGYISIKLGYKYVFSETQEGFYLIPSFGYCHTIFTYEGADDVSADGIAGALEGGYSLGVGQRGNLLNFGLKYEYDRGNAENTVQSIGFRVSYQFGLFRKRDSDY